MLWLIQCSAKLASYAEEALLLTLVAAVDCLRLLPLDLLLREEDVEVIVGARIAGSGY